MSKYIEIATVGSRRAAVPLEQMGVIVDCGKLRKIYLGTYDKDLPSQFGEGGQGYLLCLDSFEALMEKIEHCNNEATTIKRQQGEIDKLRGLLQAMSGLPSVVDEERDIERCTVTQCYYNNELYCTCCDDVRDSTMLEDCPSFMED